MPPELIHTDPDVLMSDILGRYEKYGEKGELEKIRSAYEYARKSHEGVLRKSGEPYIIHPVSASRELMPLEPDSTTIIATLLHDAVSDGTATYAEIEKKFGHDVRSIVENLDLLSNMKYHGNEEAIARMQKMILSMASDIRTLFVKLGERIHNLRTIQYHNDTERAKRIANESLFVYAPIAARLGLYEFKETLETLSFRTLDLDAYLYVTGELAHYTLEQDEFLTQSIDLVRRILPEKYHEGVSYRIKKPYSIYRKMQSQKAKSIKELYDIFAVRIIVDTLADCYAVLGIIHGEFTPLPGRFKDFIAVPKLNNYQSLHTTVIGLSGKNGSPTEIQIRTKEMDYHAEHGTAAHVLYKTYGDELTQKAALQDVLYKAAEGILDVRAELGKKVSLTIFVLTPHGDVRELPRGSTPVDFAYSIHSDIGYHTTGARVNGRMVTLDTELKNGDIVEVITNPHAHPVPQWLDFVRSTKARAEVNIEVKRLSGDREKVVQKGMQMVRSAFSEAGIPLKPDFSDLTQFLGHMLDAKKMDELLYQVGQGIRKPSSFLPPKKKIEKPKFTTIPPKISPTVIVGGTRNVPYQFAQCCTPEFPHALVAVSRSGGKCMVHLADCGSLNRVNPARILPAYWLVNEKGKVVELILRFVERKGVLAELTSVLYQAGANIIDISTSISDDGQTFEAVLNIEIPKDDISYIERLIERISVTVPDFLGYEQGLRKNHK